MGSGRPQWAKSEYSFATSALEEIQKSGVKIMVAVGGWGLSAPFREAAKTDDSRAAFVKSIVGFVEKANLDGIDIDWE